MKAVWILSLSLCACGATPKAKVEMPDLVKEDGELAIGEVSFRVRPLGGPGTKGPHEVSAESEPALEAVAGFLAAHPEARVRIECTANAYTIDAMPAPAWPASLANLVAQRLVARGVDCRRLEVMGFLVHEIHAPHEVVRFYDVARAAAPRADGAAVDPCAEK
jgi:hypothetical protein